MRTKELLTGNYMEALLQASLLLGDLHRSAPVHEITISGFMIYDSVRKLYPRCKIVAQVESNSFPISTVIPAPLAVLSIVMRKFFHRHL